MFLTRCHHKKNKSIIKFSRHHYLSHEVQLILVTNLKLDQCASSQAKGFRSTPLLKLFGERSGPKTVGLIAKMISVKAPTVTGASSSTRGASPKTRDISQLV